MAALCSQPETIENAEKRNNLILRMPDGSMHYCAGHFEIQPKVNNWRLLGEADFRIGDLSASAGEIIG